MPHRRPLGAFELKTTPDLTEVVELGRRGLLQIDVEHFSFSDIELAFDRLEAGMTAGRVVVLPNG